MKILKNWWENATSVIEILFTIYSYFIGPIFAVWTTLNVGELLRENKDKEEEEKKHKEKNFKSTVILGWNIFKRIINPTTNALEGLELTIPTEAVFYLVDMLKYDPKLHQKVLDNLDEPGTEKGDPTCPDFMVCLKEKTDQLDFVRTLSNLISSTYLKHSTKARLAKENPDDEENPIFCVTCEKEPGVPTLATRIWLIYPSELKMLQKYRNRINDKTFFRVHKENWRIRIKNLLLWADAEFDEVTGKRVPRPYNSEIIFL